MSQNIYNPNLTGEVVINDVALAKSASELNALPTILTEVPSSVSLAVAAAAGTAQAVTIQLLDKDGAVLTGIHHLRVYYSDDADGSGVAATGPNTGVSATTGKIVVAEVANKVFSITTDASGVAVISGDNAGGAGAFTGRFVVVTPGSGLIAVSAALAIPNA